MKEIISVTLQELIQLDEDFSRKTKRERSGNVKNLIGKGEKVIFCYYRLVSYLKPTLLGTYQDIRYYILTDTRLLFTNEFPPPIRTIREIMLEEVKRVSTPFGFGSGSVGVNDFTFIDGVKDAKLLENIADMIRKAKSNLDYRLRSSPSSNNHDDIAEQLEKLARLHKSGSITDKEYSQAKERILSS